MHSVLPLRKPTTIWWNVRLGAFRACKFGCQTLSQVLNRKACVHWIYWLIVHFKIKVRSMYQIRLALLCESTNLVVPSGTDSQSELFTAQTLAALSLSGTFTECFIWRVFMLLYEDFSSKTLHRSHRTTSSIEFTLNFRVTISQCSKRLAICIQTAGLTELKEFFNWRQRIN